MKYILLTVDYEIFGNGAGDVNSHMVEPMDRLANLGERHGCPFTVFVEMEEVESFRAYSKGLKQSLGYDPYNAIREQIKELSRKGHDIQLHLHPQWHQATWNNGVWRLDESKQAVDHLFEEQEETDHYIQSRLDSLNEMIDGEGSRVNAYRAGAFWARPGTRLIQSLAKCGIRFESSVVKHYYSINGAVDLDYRDCPENKQAWRISRDVVEECKDGAVWEVPIYAKPGRRLNQIGWERLRAKFSKHIPKQHRQELSHQLGMSLNPMKMCRFLLQKTALKLDFHNMNAHAMYQWIQEDNQYGESPFGFDLYVMIGHTKEHVSDGQIAKLLRLIKGNPDMEVITFTRLDELLVEKGQAVGSRLKTED